MVGVSQSVFHVLLVDDDPNVLEVMAGLLSTLGCRVRTATRGHEAVDLLQHTSVNLVITDYRMPGMTGLEVARSLHELHPHLPVVLMSGYDPNEFLDAVARRDVSGFLPKPFELDELTSLIATHGGPSSNSQFRAPSSEFIV